MAVLINNSPGGSQKLSLEGIILAFRRLRKRSAVRSQVGRTGVCSRARKTFKGEAIARDETCSVAHLYLNDLPLSLTG